MSESSFWWTTNDTGDGPLAGYTSGQVTRVWRLFTNTTNRGGVSPVDNNLLEVTFAAGEAFVDTGAAIVYGYGYENTSTKAIAVPTPGASTRIDIIALRVDWAAQTVRAVRVPGTEGAGVPSLTQSAGTTWEIPLAEVSITTGGVGTVTDRREWLTLVGDAAITAAKIADGAVTDTAFSGVLSASKGGTGVNNASRTLTINTNGGTIAFSSGGITLTIPATGTAVTEAGTQTLTNKTLTTPTISSTGFTNAQHAHTGASSGGQLSLTAAVTGVLPSANGGTGVNNGGRTLTVNTNSGTLAFSSGSLTLTVPATGTAAILGATQTFSGVNTFSDRVIIGSVNFRALSSTNLAIGSTAGQSITTASLSVLLGDDAGANLSTGSANVAIGTGALTNSSSSNNNVAIGVSALQNNGGQGCAALGRSSLQANTFGDYNTALGYESGGVVGGGNENTTGSNNTFIGNGAKGASSTASNVITLGNSSIATLRCQVTTITALSDRRDKTDIKPLALGLNFVNSLKPVQFSWNMRDGAKVGVPDAGFIAQDLQDATAQFDAEYLRLVYDENPEKLEATPGNLIPVLVRAIQELTERVSHLEAQ